MGNLLYCKFEGEVTIPSSVASSRKYYNVPALLRCCSGQVDVVDVVMGQELSVPVLQEHISSDFKGCFYHPSFSGCTPSGSYATCAVCV